MQYKTELFTLAFHFSYQKQNVWLPVPEEAVHQDGFLWRDGDAVYCGKWQDTPDGLQYSLSFDAPYQTQLRFAVELLGEQALFHVIPCNVYGDNHAAEAKPGEFPLLTEQHPEVAMCSPRWEFRADRAAMPLSALCCARGAAALCIDPYSPAVKPAAEEADETGQPYLRNGVFAALPNIFGVSLGYTNDPVTFLNRSTPQPSTRGTAHSASASGTLRTAAGNRTALHEVIRAEYKVRHTRAKHRHNCTQAVRGLLETFTHLNYDAQAAEYTNRHCRPPQDTALKPWRAVKEIGWTGGAVLAYPLALSRQVLGVQADALLRGALSGEALFDRIVSCYNEKSGLLNDLTSPIDSSESRVNGWWTGYGLVRDCHCAYNVGSALHYLTKLMWRLHSGGKRYPDAWLDCARKVLSTVVDLQAENGGFGYTYALTERRVLDSSGFAGCWFVPALVYLARLTNEDRWRQAADKALRYYYGFVRQLNCYGTPMDTWKSVDEEGNLAFIRGSRLLHEDTGAPEYLQMLKDGAGYEFLWRYGYKTRPAYCPLNDGWNACGGSVTSVSNPHIHPMGVIVDSDLRYLGRVSKDSYYTDRAEDSTAWMLQTLELYPEKTGYGQYGVLSERWCPSDGLTIERYSDGNAYSSWFSFNLWAGACVMEAACEHALEMNGI